MPNELLSVRSHKIVSSNCQVLKDWWSQYQQEHRKPFTRSDQRCKKCINFTTYQPTNLAHWVVPACNMTALFITEPTNWPTEYWLTGGWRDPTFSHRNTNQLHTIRFKSIKWTTYQTRNNFIPPIDPEKYWI